MGLAFAIANVRSWELEDADAYWNAAIRLREGGELYVGAPLGADEMIAYRYAPWLAWLWLPLTSLPKLTVQVGWSALLVGAIAVALAPLAKARTTGAMCLLFLLGGLMLRTASTGNVHALMMAALVWGAPRRSGPLWIGVAASLKVVPALYALIYIGRRDWRAAGTVLAVTVLLWAPALLYDLRAYPTEAGESLSLLSIAGAAPWIAVIGICAMVAVAAARSQFAWLGASVAVIAAIPRLALYDLTYLLVWRDETNSRPRPR
jgi:hypothetical protein